MGDDGLVLDEIAGSSQMIEPGVSLTRVDVFADNRSELNLHHIMGFGSKSSPGFCPNGARYDAYCSVTMRSDYECIAPTAGMLRINEILIDGAEDESEEFVELINQTSHPLSLAGLELWSNHGLELVPRVRFYAGCLPPKGMVALYARESHSIWRPLPSLSVDFELFGFGFSNDSDFHFELRTAQQETLDVFSGSRTLIEPGVSVNRTPDGYGNEITLHDAFTSRLNSPATCTTGHLHQFGCFVSSDAARLPTQQADVGRPMIDIPVE